MFVTREDLYQKARKTTVDLEQMFTALEKVVLSLADTFRRPSIAISVRKPPSYSICNCLISAFGILGPITTETRKWKTNTNALLLNPSDYLPLGTVKSFVLEACGMAHQE